VVFREGRDPRTEKQYAKTCCRNTQNLKKVNPSISRKKEKLPLTFEIYGKVDIFILRKDVQKNGTGKRTGFRSINRVFPDLPLRKNTSRARGKRVKSVCTEVLRSNQARWKMDAHT